MVEVIIQYFRVTRTPGTPDYDILQKRQEEYSHCLRKNLEYNGIRMIHILIENEIDIDELKSQGFDIRHPKLNIFMLGKRMNYKDAFHYANTYLDGKVVIVLHTDIYLTGGFEHITKEHLDKKMYALARTNNVDGKCTGRGIRTQNLDGNIYCGTFDGFAFTTPLPKKILELSDHVQNVWGAENKLLYTFKTNGYDVITPNVLTMVHWHMTDIRPNQNWNWITIDGSLIPHKSEFYYKHLLNNPDCVGGLIPKRLGLSIMTNSL